MTNEEKAKELRIHYINDGCGDSTDIRWACEDMAEWKDQQFKAFLETIGIGEKWAAFERFIQTASRK